MSTISQRSFTGGELSPKLRSRVDFLKYQSAAAKVRNFISLRHGGLVNRPGTSFINPTKFNDKITRLIPFEAGSNGNYVLEFGHMYFRVFKNGSLIKFGGEVITSIGVVGPVVTVNYVFPNPTTITSRVILSGIVGDIGKTLNGREFEAYDYFAGNFKIRNTDGTDIVFLYGTAYTSGGLTESPYELATDYSHLDLFDIKYAQSVDVLALSNINYDNRFLKRLADDNWQFDAFIGDNVGRAICTGSVVNGTPGSTLYEYAFAAVYNGVVGPVYKAPTQLPPALDGYRSVANGNASLTPANNIILSVAVSGNWDYVNVYKKNAAGIYGLIGSAQPITSVAANFTDIGFIADANNKFPDYDYSLTKAGAVGFVQQRLWYGDIITETVSNKSGVEIEKIEREAVLGSVIGQFGSFFHQQNITDNGSVKFTAANRKFNPPRHILDLSKMVLMTENCEFVVNADGSPITPTNISIKAQSYNGCSNIPPIIINESALYIQARGSAIRDLSYNYTIDGFSGNEVSLFADHLFEGYKIVDWCYQNIPNSNVWAVRDDGKLLCLTYLKEQDVLGWSQHDFEGGKIKTIACIPGETEDFVYAVIEREVNGASVNYVEYLNSRFFDQEIFKDVVTDESIKTEIRAYSGLPEAVFVDSAIVYDGRNFDVLKKVKIENAVSMTPDDQLNLEANFNLFNSTDVGNQIFINTRDGSNIRLDIVSYTSATVVVVVPSKNVPAELNDNFTSDWARAVDELYGLHHLEGKKVSIFSDGFVDANPLNQAYEEIQVVSGHIELPFPRSFIIVGIPYVSDLKTLKIDSLQTETTMDKKTLINRLTLNLLNTRGLWAGIDEPTDITDGLYEMKPRNDEAYDKPAELKSEPDTIIIDSNFTKDGQVFIRQIDPVPVTILSVHPTGLIPARQG